MLDTLLISINLNDAKMYAYRENKLLDISSEYWSIYTLLSYRHSDQWSLTIHWSPFHSCCRHNVMSACLIIWPWLTLYSVSKMAMQPYYCLRS